jgi:cytochrome c556
LLGAAALVLTGCGQAQPEAAAPEFDTSYAMLELMAHVLQPAAERFWAGAGTVSDETGTHNLRPTTPEAWKSVEDGAITTAEAGNLLLLPGRVREPAADWRAHVQRMVAAAKAAQVAAERQADEETLLDLGGKLYETCESCHEQFAVAPGEAAPAEAQPAAR